ncbi:hypothetical protein [Bacillus paranthracis]|uniref:hypothetical protein n=1 Tax=Bacillus paranthracis TaxID=2026186 RepID=UPI000278FB9A|nr:hypothetical protein [Bacillus paranthracis]EJQ03964.1 hypothetical protein IC5_02762 [Bacillus cereus AND1407]MDG0908932.1 hypothetical protein [Bacillus paranthracis]MDR4347253.1 hypothetical protein [Bacillus paranthracis]TKC26062.1 hypothetical protein CQB03_01725 [Bacillus paranthracis]HDR7456216.1 hypothetical protein [Bacillus paranthracis]
MKVNLKLFLGGSRAKRSLKEVKLVLYLAKQHGVVFYKENIFSLEHADDFDLYFVGRPSFRTKANAFPISISEYQMFDTRDEYLGFLQSCYKRYYPKERVNKKILLGYDLANPFVGREYIWFYKK